MSSSSFLSATDMTISKPYRLFFYAHKWLNYFKGRVQNIGLIWQNISNTLQKQEIDTLTMGQNDQDYLTIIYKIHCLYITNVCCIELGDVP